MDVAVALFRHAIESRPLFVIGQIFPPLAFYGLEVWPSSIVQSVKHALRCAEAGAKIKFEHFASIWRGSSKRFRDIPRSRLQVR
jgi:hypothetical protein